MRIYIHFFNHSIGTRRLDMFMFVKLAVSDGLGTGTKNISFSASLRSLSSTIFNFLSGGVRRG